MKASAAVVAALICALCLGLGACGDSSRSSSTREATPAARTPAPAPDVTLTSDEKQLWAKLPPDRSAIPVLLYHGIGPESDFSNSADASYGVATEDFAKQLTMIDHAGYETVDLQTFIDFTQGKPVDLPARPLLLTFDDARVPTPGPAPTASWTSWASTPSCSSTSAESTAATRSTSPGRNCRPWTTAVAGSCNCTPARATSRSSTAPAPTTTGRTTPTSSRAKTSTPGRSGCDRTSAGARTRSPTTSPITGRSRSHRRTAAMARTAPATRASPEDLLGWLTQRYDAVLTQDENARARPGATQPLGRIQVTRKLTGGELHELLLSG